MWIGTDQGLSCFDGHYCETYTVTQGLSTNQVTQVFLDSQGRLWVSHSGFAVDVLDRRRGTVHHLSGYYGLTGNRASTFLEDAQGRVWIAHNNGVDVVNLAAGTVQNLTPAIGWGSHTVNTLYRDRHGRLWLGGNRNRLLLLDPARGTAQRVVLPAPASDILQVAEDSRGRLWLGTGGQGLYIIDEKLGLIQRLTTRQGLSHNWVTSLAQGLGQRMFLGTGGGGVDEYDGDHHTLKPLRVDQGGLSSNLVASMYFARDGQLWVGTSGKGINLYRTFFSARQLSRQQGLPGRGAPYYALAEDGQGRVWAGSQGDGLDVLDPARGQQWHLGKAQGWPDSSVGVLCRDHRARLWVGGSRQLNVVDTRQGRLTRLTDTLGVITALMADRQGRLWVGGVAGPTVLDERQGTVRYTNFRRGLISNFFFAFAQDHRGQVWCGSDNGLAIVSADGRSVRLVANPFGPGKNWITCLLEDADGNMWVGTAGRGLHRFNAATDRLTSFSLANGLSDLHIASLQERDGCLYVGTAKGLTVVTPVVAHARATTPAWRLVSYDKPEEFAFVDFTPGVLLARTGTLWWGVSDVLATLGTPRTDLHAPTTRLTALDLMEQPQDFGPRLPKGPVVEGVRWEGQQAGGALPTQLSLPFNRSHVTFHFVSNRLDNLAKVRYRYLLEGNDEHWSDITDQASADYRNLAPGRYTFRASSKGLHGSWGPPTAFAFTVRPPWWRTWGAYLLYLLGLSALRWSGVSYRSRRLRAENAALEATVTQRTTALHRSLQELRVAQNQLVQSEKMAALGELTAGIAHEIQNPLNFVNNFADVSAELVAELREERAKGTAGDAGLEEELLDDLTQNLGKIGAHGRRAAGIVKGMLEHSRTITGERVSTDLNRLADEYLRLAYQGLRAKDKSFNATLNTEFLADLPFVTVVGADVGRVLLNLFTNAFYAVRQRQQQGEPGYQPQVGVRTVLLHQQVQIQVTDNGMGMSEAVQAKIFQPFFTTKPTGEGTGLGLSLSHDIVAQGHGGNLSVESQEGQGATFYVNLPLNGPT
ncbi:hypothetical protein AUC43_09210 [Hymenobacter sedentarius]|uniref:histidine kinase n=2 Tax=Hymenobacter sedentarius TaxID=1411621 RepID=A0A0U4BNB8_9BACT|nr:hypothetical protein AUC43_09210 [Hymenobacter sedentarius]